MATRTAPLWTAAASDRIASLMLIDASGDLWSEAMHVPVGTTAAALETYAAAYAAASQASLYGLGDYTIRLGDADPDNADVGQRNSVKDGVNMLYKNLTTLATQSPRLIAPIAAVMQGNQDIPLLTSTELAALITATLAVLTGFNLQSAQYTERRERTNNPRIKA